MRWLESAREEEDDGNDDEELAELGQERGVCNMFAKLYHLAKASVGLKLERKPDLKPKSRKNFNATVCISLDLVVFHVNSRVSLFIATETLFPLSH